MLHRARPLRAALPLLRAAQSDRAWVQICFGLPGVSLPRTRVRRIKLDACGTCVSVELTVQNRQFEAFAWFQLNRLPLSFSLSLSRTHTFLFPSHDWAKSSRMTNIGIILFCGYRASERASERARERMQERESARARKGSRERTRARREGGGGEERECVCVCLFVCVCLCMRESL